MSDDAEAGLATRAAGRAEYDAEFSDEGGAIEKVEAPEVMDLLGPSRRDRTQKLVLAFRKRIVEAEREVAEMQEREVSLQARNREHVAHQAKLKQEREELFALLDRDRPDWRLLREENARLKAELAARSPIVETAVTAPASWWDRLWGRA